jgi:hypothetical protein
MDVIQLQSCDFDDNRIQCIDRLLSSQDAHLEISLPYHSRPKYVTRNIFVYICDAPQKLGQPGLDRFSAPLVIICFLSDQQIPLLHLISILMAQKLGGDVIGK